MTPTLYWLDAFCDKPFSGNPAAVCLCTEMPDEHWMQHLAAEFNLSETAFVAPITQNRYALRWFTPSCEVDLCGHATLAAATALWAEQPSVNELVFVTRSGELSAQRNGGTTELCFPSDPPQSVVSPHALTEVFGSALVATASCRFGLIAQLNHAESVRQWAMDLDLIQQLPFPGLILTASTKHPEVDFVSRVFAPKLGINEDPVTGAAHCALAPYWSSLLDKPQLLAHQVSQRQGQLNLTSTAAGVILAGRCQLIMKGRLHV